MPIYEYHCCCCNRCFETLVLRSSDSPPRCVHCGADTVERLLSSFACKVAASDSGHQASGAGCGSTGFS